MTGDGGGGGAIDDMMMMQSETGGSWYTYSDRTVPNSEPPQPIAGLPGMVTPKEGDAFYPTAATDPKAPMINGMPFPFREASGSGYSTWGVGFGMDLTSLTPDGGAVAFNMCPTDAGMEPIFDTSGKTMNVGIPQPYDAKGKGFTGFSFWGTSFATGPQTVSVQLDDGDTDPWAGKCDPCQNGGPCSGAGAAQHCACSGSFSVGAIFPAGTWKQFSVHWTDKTLVPAGWTMQGLKAGNFDATTMYNIHFQLTTMTGKALPAFDVGVADLEWLTN